MLKAEKATKVDGYSVIRVKSDSGKVKLPFMAVIETGSVSVVCSAVNEKMLDVDINNVIKRHKEQIEYCKQCIDLAAEADKKGLGRQADAYRLKAEKASKNL
jgi:hypothetical protein